MEEQKEHAVTRTRGVWSEPELFCHIWASAGNTLLAFCTIKKTIHEYKDMDKTDLQNDICST